MFSRLLLVFIFFGVLITPNSVFSADASDLLKVGKLSGISSSSFGYLSMIDILNQFFGTSDPTKLGEKVFLNTTSVLKPFGGTILVIRPCYNFPGFHIVLGPPTAGSYIYQTGVSVSYLYGPPSFVGQWLLGVAGPIGICDVAAGDNFRGLGGSAIMFHGSSGTDPNACAQKGANIIDDASKLATENAVRDSLTASGVGVNKAGCGFGKSYKNTPGGCTDVSSLQCGTTSYLKSLTSLCSGSTVMLTGGSETGHSTHNGGNAFDLNSNSSLNSCVKSNFTEIADDRNGFARWLDPNSGAIWTLEKPAGFNTGAHWHVCVLGTDCH